MTIFCFLLSLTLFSVPHRECSAQSFIDPLLPLDQDHFNLASSSLRDCPCATRGSIRARSHRTRKQISMQTLWCCLQPVWTLPLTIMCSKIGIHLLRGAPRPVWTGPKILTPHMLLPLTHRRLQLAGAERADPWGLGSPPKDNLNALFKKG